MVEDLFIAKTVQEAVSYVKNGYIPLAGGTEINRLDSFVQADKLVSLGRIEELDGIKTVDSNTLEIGAMVTFSEVLASNAVPQYFKTACAYMSSMVKRNMATVGGNVALRRDDSYLWSVLISSKARLTLVSEAGSNVTITCEDYLKNSDKYSKSIILSVILDTNAKVISKRYANTAASHAAITMAVGKFDSGLVFGLCLKNGGIHQFDDVKSIEQIKCESDMFGSAEYKKYLLNVTAQEFMGELEGLK